MTRYRLSGTVMTHPKRRAAAESLAQAAPPGALRVVMDPDPGGRPSVLRTALCAWSAIEDGATHQLVVQDDMILSDTFFERARAAIKEMPDAALALFALWDSRNGAAVRFGAMTGARWVGAVNEYFPCVAIILPRRVADGFVAFGRRHLDSWPDDILMYRYLRANGIPSYVSVPSLAEHEDHGSISGNAFRGPRRSVCFLPSDMPGREETRLTGLKVLPFFKHGVAQCAVRLDGPDPGRWLHLDCAQYLEGCGVRVERLQSAIAGMAEAATPAAAKGTWLTAFTMGFVQRREGLGRAGEPDPEVLAEALATVGPGGISHAQPEERIAELRDELARIARAGVEAGGEAAGRPRTRRTAAGPCRVGVLGAGTPLGEHLVRGLADDGHQVTALGPGRQAEQTLDAVLDLTALGASPGADGSRITLNSPSHEGVCIVRTGDLYGPGCPHDSRIGRMVWDALRSRPLTFEEPPGALLRPLHTSDLVGGLSAMLRTPPSERAIGLADAATCTVAEMAQAVRKAVRPVPIADRAAPSEAPGARAKEAEWPPPPPGWKATTDLTYGLHTYAQWLAYEGIHGAPDA
ncbi:hypothetical protein ACH4SK_03425 [Streptomyces inhibens]|uniref:hypothetical protein n=1 Tax=Streptomyces inhibens TaxID=2293571 RepID=UPI00378A8C8A